MMVNGQWLMEAMLRALNVCPKAAESCEGQRLG